MVTVHFLKPGGILTHREADGDVRAFELERLRERSDLITLAEGLAVSVVEREHVNRIVELGGRLDLKRSFPFEGLDVERSGVFAGEHKVDLALLAPLHVDRDGNALAGDVVLEGRNGEVVAVGTCTRCGWCCAATTSFSRGLRSSSSIAASRGTAGRRTTSVTAGGTAARRGKLTALEIVRAATIEITIRTAITNES